MPKYGITLFPMIRFKVDVEADSPQQAIEQALIVLDEQSRANDNVISGENDGAECREAEVSQIADDPSPIQWWEYNDDSEKWEEGEN